MARAAHKTTKLFRFYVANLILRALLLAAAVAALICAPEQLSITEGFGIAHGFTLIDLIFVLLVADGLTKLFPSAKIAVGSLKQFGRYHVPTLRLLLSHPDRLRTALRETIAHQRTFAAELPAQLRKRWNETREGARESLSALLSNFTFLKRFPFKRDQLEAADLDRTRIKADRFREILPVIIFWVLFNGAVGLVLGLCGLLTEEALVLWMLIFFLFDMICVVLWCPLQLLFMKNRCCTTCQIFNWDAAMTVTPLLFIVGSLSAAPFTWPLIALALVVLLRWELAFARHPERFDERTNASLSCVNCVDKLCHVREPLAARMRGADLESLRTTATEEVDALLLALTPSSTNAGGEHPTATP